MNKTQAIDKLRKLLGKKLAYRVNPRAPDAEQREVMRAEFHGARGRKVLAETARDERRAAVLAADVEYQLLKLDAAAAAKAAETAAAWLHTARVSVGTINDLGAFAVFHVAAEGDNWAEVVAKVEADKKVTT